MRFFGFLILVLIVVAVVGFSLGWFQFTSQRTGADQDLDLTLKVHPDKFKQTVHKVEHMVTGSEHVKGNVQTVQDHGLTLTKAEDKEALTFDVAADAKVRRGDHDVPLADLHKGDSVTVTYKVQDGKNVASAVKVNAP